MDNKKEKTLVIVKPDGVQRSLIGEIVQRFERSGLKLVALKMVVPTAELVEKHYLVDPEWKTKVGTKTISSYQKKGKNPPSDDPIVIADRVLGNLKRYMTASPVIPMVWQGMHAVGVIKKMAGGTEPLTSDVGTIRGDYTIDSYEVSDIDGRAVRNILHVSTSPEEAEQEIKLWFKPAELIQYRLISESILYDVNLDGILE